MDNGDCFYMAGENYELVRRDDDNDDEDNKDGNDNSNGKSDKNNHEQCIAMYWC